MARLGAAKHQLGRIVGAAVRGGEALSAAIWAFRQTAQIPWLTGPEGSPAGVSTDRHHAQIARM